MQVLCLNYPFSHISSFRNSRSPSEAQTGTPSQWSDKLGYYHPIQEGLYFSQKEDGSRWDVIFRSYARSAVVRRRPVSENLETITWKTTSVRFRFRLLVLLLNVQSRRMCWRTPLANCIRHVDRWSNVLDVDQTISGFNWIDKKLFDKKVEFGSCIFPVFRCSTRNVITELFPGWAVLIYNLPSYELKYVILSLEFHEKISKA